MPIAYPVSHLRQLARAEVGPLAYALASVSRGFELLSGICLTATAYQHHLRRAKVWELLRRPVVTTPADIDKLAAGVMDAILATPVGPAVSQALEASRRRHRAWLVRASSDDVEPFTQVVPDADRVQAARAAWASPWAPRRVRIRLGAGQALTPPPPAVLLQALPSQVRVSGVIRPAPGGGGWEVAVWAGWWARPDSIGSRFFVPGSGSVLPERDALLSSREISDLVARAQRVASHALEVHWLLAGSRMYAVEARRALTQELRGIAASPGTVTGVARLVRTARDASRLQPNEIVVAAFLAPALTACVPRMAGIVVESGGSTSHLAVVARQFRVPAVLAAYGATELISDGQRLTVDGTRGLVQLEQPAG